MCGSVFFPCLASILDSCLPLHFALPPVQLEAGDVCLSCHVVPRGSRYRIKESGLKDDLSM